MNKKEKEKLNEGRQLLRTALIWLDAHHYTYRSDHSPTANKAPDSLTNLMKDIKVYIETKP